MNNLKITIWVISFVVMFFTMFPIHLECDEECLKWSLLLSLMFAGFNVSIYNFFIGDSFFFPIMKGAIVDSLHKNPSKKKYFIRKLGLLHSVSWIVIIFYGVYKLSWIFN